MHCNLSNVDLNFQRERVWTLRYTAHTEPCSEGDWCSGRNIAPRIGETRVSHEGRIVHPGPNVLTTQFNRRIPLLNTE
jgi:hypothetical protein